MKPSLHALDRTGFVVTAVRGRAQVLAHIDLLQDLAVACDQRGVVDHLAFRFSDPYFGEKLPTLFLLHDSASAKSRGSLPVAAVLLHEYRLLGLRTGMYIPADSAGDATLLAPGDLRAEVAQRIAAHLLENGAYVALLTFPAVAGAAAPSRGFGAPIPLATAQRPLLRTLPLRGTLDETLSTMGPHTRRNLRLARRQAIARLGAYLEPQAELSEEEFLELNREGFYPVPDRVARWRYRSAQENTGGFITGVRAAGGDWLALLGGRRFPTAKGLCTAVDWQWNRMSLSRFSPGSLMRILLIEQELASGTADLRFEGGTPHSMRSAFQREQVTDVLYARPRVSAGLMRVLRRVLPKGNLLGDLLNSPHLVWR